MFQYALFDLDGTLTDPKEGICKCVQFALMQQGIHEPNLDKLEPFIGPPLRDSFIEFYGMTNPEATTAIADYRKRFDAIGLFENKVYPGIPEMLSKLRDAGMILAVASSKPEGAVNRILEHFDLQKYFSVIVGSTLDESRSTKEEVLEETLKRMESLGNNLNADNCVMVGDRKFDINGGHQFELTTVGVSYGYAPKGELEKAGADYIAKNVKQLEHILLSFGSNRADDAGNGIAGKDSTGNGIAGKDSTGNDIAGKDSTGNGAGKVFSMIISILTPVVLYYIGYNMCYLFLAAILHMLSDKAIVAQSVLLGNGVLITNLVHALSMLTGAALLWPFLRKENINWSDHTKNDTKNHTKGRKLSTLSACILSATMAMGVNILFSLLQIQKLSEAYIKAAETQYQLPIVHGLILFGLISPFAEEILFRGLIYNRMKKYFSTNVSIIISSVMFGAYHGNLVQALYGFMLGAMIAWLYESYGRFTIPVLAHGIANVVVFLLTYDAEISSAFKTPVNCAVLLLVSSLCIRNITMQKKRIATE